MAEIIVIDTKGGFRMLFFQEVSTYGMRHPPNSISHAFIQMEGVYRGGYHIVQNNFNSLKT